MSFIIDLLDIYSGKEITYTTYPVGFRTSKAGKPLLRDCPVCGLSHCQRGDGIVKCLVTQKPLFMARSIVGWYFDVGSMYYGVGFEYGAATIQIYEAIRALCPASAVPLRIDRRAITFKADSCAELSQGDYKYGVRVVLKDYEIVPGMILKELYT